MRRILSIALVCCAGLLLPACSKNDPNVDGYADSDFEEMVDNLNINNEENTSLSSKTYWEEIHGKQVTWEGEVVDVKAGVGDSAEIFLAKDERPLYRGYNVVVKCYDSTAAKLKKGDEITITGSLARYKSHRGNPVVLVIDNGSIKE